MSGNKISAAACCPLGQFEFKDFVFGACYPCAYGSGLAHSKHPSRPEGCLPNTIYEFFAIAGWCAFGTIVPCIIGIGLRSSDDTGNDTFFGACLAETFPIFSCAPCQMSRYARGKPANASPMGTAAMMPNDGGDFY